MSSGYSHFFQRLSPKKAETEPNKSDSQVTVGSAGDSVRSDTLNAYLECDSIDEYNFQVQAALLSTKVIKLLEQEDLLQQKTASRLRHFSRTGTALMASPAVSMQMSPTSSVLFPTVTRTRSSSWLSTHSLRGPARSPTASFTERPLLDIILDKHSVETPVPSHEIIKMMNLLSSLHSYCPEFNSVGAPMGATCTVSDYAQVIASPEAMTRLVVLIRDMVEAKAPTPLISATVPAGGRMVVCGDTHAQLQDVMWVFFKNGVPSPTNIYVFNGDICDRGSHAVEIFLILFLFKLNCYNSVHIIRGNHEDDYCNIYYGFLAELKHKQQEEINSVRREGDRQLDDLQRHYRETTYRNFRDGEKALKEQQSRNALAQEHDLLASTSAQEKARQNQELQMQMLKDHHEQQSRDLNQNYRAELNRARERTEEAKMQADEAFSKSFDDLSVRQQKMISDLDTRTARQLNTLRDANALKLAAYESRTDDEFYRLRHMNASIEENDDNYIVRAQIPEHERKNLAVSVQGSVVTLTNQRRNQEEQLFEPGRRQATSSYQIITESFPLPMPVDPRAVRREFDGETFIVTIPKKSTYSATPQMAGNRGKKDPASIEKLKAERPRFPENLPLDQPEIDRQIAESRLPKTKSQSRLAGVLPAEAPRGKSRGVPGGGTLT